MPVPSIPSQDTSRRYRPGFAALATTGALTSIAFANLAMAGMGLARAGEPLLIVALASAGAWYGAWRGMDARLTSILSTVAFLFAIAMVSAILIYASTASGRPQLWDDTILAADRAIGFDWFGFVGFFDQSPIVCAILKYVYLSIWTQVFVLSTWFALRADNEGIDAIAMALCLSIVVTALVAALFPVIGITAGHDIAFVNTDVAGGRTGQPDFIALRSGALRTVDFGAINGIVTFPSYHSVIAVLMALAAGRAPFARWLFWPLNVAMLVATVTHGGHYLMDIIAGTAIAVASWRAALALSRWRAAPHLFARRRRLGVT